MVQAVAAAPVRIVRLRRETPEQWNRALQRAIAEALDVLTEPQSGRTFVESGTTPGIVYEVTEHGCSCKAGQNGVPCKHRACLLAQLGILPLDTEPESASASAPTVRRCSWYAGAGLVEQWGVSAPIGALTCPDCGGSGIAAPLAA
jgi:hypothetical protein